MNDRQFEETADAAPAAAPAVGHEETAAVAAVANSDMPGDLPRIAWSEVQLAECEAIYWRKPAGEREDVLTLIRALRVARTSLAEALDAYRSGRHAMRAECDRLRTRVADLQGERAREFAPAEIARLRWRPLDGGARTGQPMLLRGGAKAAREGRPEWVGYWHEGAAESTSMWDQWGTWEQQPAEYVPLAEILAVVSGGAADPVAIAAAERLCEDALHHAAAMQRERDEARAAGRELVAENAALRTDLVRWQEAVEVLAMRALTLRDLLAGKPWILEG